LTNKYVDEEIKGDEVLKLLAKEIRRINMYST